MDELHVYHIGEYGEVFAARSEQEAKDYYTEMVGDKEEAEEAFNFEFTEITDIDTPIVMNMDGEKERLSWRQLAEMTGVPSQLSTTYY